VRRRFDRRFCTLFVYDADGRLEGWEMFESEREDEALARARPGPMLFGPGLLSQWALIDRAGHRVGAGSDVGDGPTGDVAAEDAGAVGPGGGHEGQSRNQEGSTVSWRIRGCPIAMLTAREVVGQPPRPCASVRRRARRGAFAVHYQPRGARTASRRSAAESTTRVNPTLARALARDM